jgi:hypothetical protein
MRRSATRPKLGAVPDTGKILGVSTPFLLFGVVAAAGVAYLSSGSDEPTTSAVGSGAAAGSTSGGSSSGTTPTAGGSSAGGSSTPAVTKKKRPPLVGMAKPSLYVFINSIGGEGIFDRIRTNFSVLDGYGLDRIRTLANGEFAGYDTGVRYTQPDTGRVYMKLYYEIGNFSYNYWVEKSETVGMHHDAAVAGVAAGNYQWGSAMLGNSITAMSDASKSAIASFYFTNYFM